MELVEIHEAQVVSHICWLFCTNSSTQRFSQHVILLSP